LAETHFHLPIKPCTILQAEGWETTLPAFEAELSRKLGGKLPAAVGETASMGRWLAIRIAPRRFWFVADEKSDPPLSIDAVLGSLVWLSESRMRLKLHGPRTFDILGACVAIDWHAEEARPGRAVQIGFHHVPVLLLRTAADACDLLMPRGFAESLAEWVADIAEPYEAPGAAMVSA
jgi:heterotetrameric sarcosine oxidase gamma subunit